MIKSSDWESKSRMIPYITELACCLTQQIQHPVQIMFLSDRVGVILFTNDYYSSLFLNEIVVEAVNSCSELFAREVDEEESSIFQNTVSVVWIDDVYGSTWKVSVNELRGMNLLQVECWSK